MICQEHDRDLLLLSHGELGGVRLLLTEAHLRRCPHCRQRRARYGVLSSAMADAVRGERMPRWKCPAPERAAPAASLRWAIAAAVAALLTLGASAALTAAPETPLAAWLHFGRKADSCGAPLEPQGCPPPVQHASKNPSKNPSGGRRLEPQPVVPVPSQP